MVVVGATAPSLQDVHRTSTARSVVMSGAELQASAISTALRGFPLREAPGPCGALVVVLMALLAPLASLRLRLLGIAALAVAALVTYAAAAQLLFGAGLVVPVAGPVLAVALGAMGALGMRVAAEARARRRTREAFSRFVPEAVVRELVDRGETVSGLPGRRVEATVLFCDLFWLAERDLEPLEMGVGLNSGPVMSGTVGSQRRREYAAVGDTTNVAARLEELTKERGGGLLMTGRTRKLLGSEPGVIPAGETRSAGAPRRSPSERSPRAPCRRRTPRPKPWPSLRSPWR